MSRRLIDNALSQCASDGAHCLTIRPKQLHRQVERQETAFSVNHGRCIRAVVDFIRVILAINGFSEMDVNRVIVKKTASKSDFLGYLDVVTKPGALNDCMEPISDLTPFAFEARW